MKLFLFEMKKTLYTKAFTLFILLTVLFISGLYIKNTIQQDMIIVNKVQQFSEHRSDVFRDIQQYRHLLEELPDAKTEKKLQAALNLYGEINELIQSIQEKQWDKELQTEMNVYQSAMEYQDMEGTFDVNQRDMQEMILLNEELIKKGLPKEDLNLSIEPSIFMKKIITLLLNPFGFLVLLLILGISVTKEFEEKNIQMVYVLPISRPYYILNKFVSLMSLGVCWLFIVFSISFLLPFIFTSTTENSFSYPLTSTEGNFITSSHYLKEAIIYSLFYMIFSVSIIIFFGFLIRNTIITSLILVFLHIGNFIVLMNGFVYSRNPLTYGMIDFAILNDENQLFFGTSLLAGLSVLIIIISIVLNKRRGIR